MNREERNAHLVELYLAGDEEAGNALIIENLPLVKTTVRHILNECPDYSHLHADLIGEGQLTLTRVVREMTEPPISFHNLIIQSVRMDILKCFQEKKKDIYYKEPRCLNASLDNLPADVLAVECPDLRLMEDREFLLSLCVSERERSILQLYFEGCTPKDIARALGCSSNSVSQTMGRFKSRIRRQHLVP